MMEDFSAGDLDLVFNITPVSAKELVNNKNIKVDTKPGNTFTYVGWNFNNQHLKNKEIRKALTMAIDTKQILNEVFAGMGTISLGPLPPSSWGYNEGVEPIKHDLPGAKRILEKLGFEDRNRNKILDIDRKDFTLDIITNVENAERVKILKLIAEDLGALGVRVNVRTLNTRSFIEAIVKRDFDGFIMGWSVGEKIDPTVYWYSDPAKGRFNFIGYKNTVVDSLIDLGVAMLNRKKAEEIWNEFQRIVYEDIPYTFLIVANDITASYKRVKGADQGFVLASAYTYWIPEAERRVAIASLQPAVDTTTTPSEKPAELETKPAEITEKPPEIVAPEKLLEAVVKKETTAVAIALPDTGAGAPPITPLEPPKPSVITRPQVTKRIQPRYPEAAKAVGAAGTIVVRVVVGTDGKVKNPTILSSFGNPACEVEALAAAKKFEFKPATKDGVPFEQKISIPCQLFGASALFDLRPPVGAPQFQTLNSKY
jgi:TonB family protein